MNPEPLSAPRTIVSPRLPFTMPTHQLIPPAICTRSHERLRNEPNFTGRSHNTPANIIYETKTIPSEPPSADPPHPPTRKYQTNPISPTTDCKQNLSASPGEPDSIPILQPCHPAIAKPFCATCYTGISHAQSPLRAFPHWSFAHRQRSARPRNLPAPH